METYVEWLYLQIEHVRLKKKLSLNAQMYIIKLLTATQNKKRVCIKTVNFFCIVQGGDNKNVDNGQRFTQMC